MRRVAQTAVRKLGDACMGAIEECYAMSKLVNGHGTNIGGCGRKMHVSLVTRGDTMIGGWRGFSTKEITGTAIRQSSRTQQQQQQRLSDRVLTALGKSGGKSLGGAGGGMKRLSARGNAVLGAVCMGGGLVWYSLSVRDEATCYTSRDQRLDMMYGAKRKHRDGCVDMDGGIVLRVWKELALLQRSLYLTALFFPLVLLYPLTWFQGRYKDSWFRLMKWTLEMAGPAFLKWGQWAATRPDLFPPDVCKALEALQTQAPSHKFAHTKNAVENSFGCPLEELFLQFDPTPVASGSIAQVHKAVLSPRGAAMALHRSPRAVLTDLNAIKSNDSRLQRKSKVFGEGNTVAVKVRHPRVDEYIEADFLLMNRMVALAGRLFPRSLAVAQLKESLMQFGAPMKDQLDLRSEAAYLDDFAENFKWWSQVRFPLPAIGLVTEDVLVESFEEGELISSFLGQTHPHNKTLANLGMTCYLKMLLTDNLIHCDLHPGNIFVHLDAPPPGSLMDLIGRATGWNIEIPRLVLLDVGMAAKLSDNDQCNLVEFFKSLTSLDGQQIADSILAFADKVGDAKGFKEDMSSLFAALDPETLRKNTQDVIGKMMDTLREHGVQIPGAISTVVITTMVLEGWSTKLNPDIRILESLKNVLASENADSSLDSLDVV